MAVALINPFMSILDVSNPANSTIDTTDNTVHTFTSLSLGAVADDRLLYALFGNTSQNILSFTGCTINGVTATEIVQIDNNDANFAGAAIYGALVPTGTTGNVVVTTDNAPGANRGISVSLFRITGKGSDVSAFDTASNFTVGNTTATLALTIDAEAGGCILAVGAGMGVAGAATWANLTKVSDQPAGAATTISQAGNAITSDTTNLAITVDFTNGGAGQAAVAVSLAP